MLICKCLFVSIKLFGCLSVPIKIAKGVSIGDTGTIGVTDVKMLDGAGVPIPEYEEVALKSLESHNTDVCNVKNCCQCVLSRKFKHWRIASASRYKDADVCWLSLAKPEWGDFAVGCSLCFNHWLSKNGTKCAKASKLAHFKMKPYLLEHCKQHARTEGHRQALAAHFQVDVSVIRAPETCDGAKEARTANAAQPEEEEEAGVITEKDIAVAWVVAQKSCSAKTAAALCGGDCKNNILPNN